MSDELPLLPIFPLGTVLFPGGALPLHIFEERYKLMIGACIAARQPFGVVLIRSGPEVGEGATPFAVGTTARIVRVEELPQGRLNILTIGAERFRIVAPDSSRAFLQARVSYLPREDGPAAAVEAVAEQVRTLFSEYYRLTLLLGDQWTRDVAIPTRPAMLADFVAGRLEVAMTTKQRLLEAETAHDCLALEVTILTEAVRLLEARVAAQQRQKFGGFGALN